MFSHIQNDLDTVYQNVERAFQLKAGPISSFLPDLAISPLDHGLRPALLLLASRISGGEREKAVVMATVVQYIFLAQAIHNRIPDGGPKELPQFPVLIGDYLYSKYFQTLSENSLLHWLAPLAETICRMNEGGIRRYLILENGQPTPEDFRLTAAEEEGLLLAQSCRIGALLGGGKKAAAALEGFGHNLGTAWGIVKGAYPLEIGEYLADAGSALAGIDPGREKETLQMILDQIGEASCQK